MSKRRIREGGASPLEGRDDRREGTTSPPHPSLLPPFFPEQQQRRMYKMHQSKSMLYSVLALWCTLKKQDKTRPDTAAIRHLLTPRLSPSPLALILGPETD